MNTTTATRSFSDTFTEARLKAVMPEIGGDFYALASAGIISMDRAKSWADDLSFILKHRAATKFQIQLNCPGRDRIALDFRVSSDGSIQGSQTSGGIDYYSLPQGTTGTLLVTIDNSSTNAAMVRAWTQQRGWGQGQEVEGEPVRDRVYSKDGYGVVRGKVGTWP